MARFKLQAGMELDLLTKAEVLEALQSWRNEITRGITWKTFSGRADAAGGVYTIDCEPAAGMVWAITRIAVSGNAITLGTDTFNLYLDEVTPGRLVGSGYLRQTTFDVGVLVITGPRSLVVTGPATNVAGTDVHVSGAAVELPETIAWQLL